ncbi:hypothetical protein [Micromonospora carbonacea]|uniref:hypothetical protein n=1 Tax=Micromonospora carbonacea TaxID=47853 RepID=UPI0037216A7C
MSGSEKGIEARYSGGPDPDEDFPDAGLRIGPVEVELDLRAAEGVVSESAAHVVLPHWLSTADANY